MVNDEYYSRDVSGKEIAIYHSSDLYQWNVWGTDNVGKINANGDKFFYLKDHLGTIRVVLNESNQIVSANDYDCWGYPLEGRSFLSDGANIGSLDYKFTSKQRDTETGWDYFGARYYDARIANWGSVDPLFEKHIGWTPYNYVLRNPMALIDPDGRQVKIIGNVGFENFMKNTVPKGFAYDPKDMTTLIFNGSKEDYNNLSFKEKVIAECTKGICRDIDGNAVVLKFVLTESQIFIDENGNPKALAGDGFGGYFVDESSKTSIGTQLFNQEVLENWESSHYWTGSQIFEHGAFECLMGAVFHLGWSKSHDLAGGNPVLSEKDKEYYNIDRFEWVTEGNYSVLKVFYTEKSKKKPVEIVRISE